MIKIAVCISGLLQCWDVTHQLFKYWNSMYDDVEFTFFISTWEVDSDFASTEKQYQKKGKLLTNTQYNSDTFDFIGKCWDKKEAGASECYVLLNGLPGKNV